MIQGGTSKTLRRPLKLLHHSLPKTVLKVIAINPTKSHYNAPEPGLHLCKVRRSLVLGIMITEHDNGLVVGRVVNYFDGLFKIIQELDLAVARFEMEHAFVGEWEEE
jgi:hypothetical protein